mgnify:CR=1 FL=1
MSYSLYLFDFDYTLVNSEEGILKCFRLTLDAYARPQVPDDVIRKTIGLPMEEAVRRITGYEDAAKIDAFIEDYRHLADRYMTPGTHFFPDTLDVLRDLGAHVGSLLARSRRSPRSDRSKVGDAHATSSPSCRRRPSAEDCRPASASRTPRAPAKKS